jgi:hypothetical protein
MHINMHHKPICRISYKRPLPDSSDTSGGHDRHVRPHMGSNPATNNVRPHISLSPARSLVDKNRQDPKVPGSNSATNNVRPHISVSPVRSLVDNNNEGPKVAGSDPPANSVRPHISVSPARASVDIDQEGPNIPRSNPAVSNAVPIVLDAEMGENNHGEDATASAVSNRSKQIKMRFSAELLKNEYEILMGEQLQDKHMSLIYDYIFGDWNMGQFDELSKILSQTQLSADGMCVCICACMYVFVYVWMYV